MSVVIPILAIAITLYACWSMMRAIQRVISHALDFQVRLMWADDAADRYWWRYDDQKRRRRSAWRRLFRRGSLAD